MTVSKSVKTPAGRARPPLRPGIVGVIASRTDLQRALRMRRCPDFFEIRLDYFAGWLDQLENKLPSLGAPIIMTARHPGEGGRHNLSPARRRELLHQFLPYAHSIDIEIRSLPALLKLWKFARRRKVRRILSFHDFESTPDSGSLRAKATAAKSAGADILKITTRTDTQDQVVQLVDFVSNQNILPVSAMGMGRLGARSRSKLLRAGSVLNYAAVGKPTVEGQSSIRQLRSALAH